MVAYLYLQVSAHQIGCTCDTHYIRPKLKLTLLAERVLGDRDGAGARDRLEGGLKTGALMSHHIASTRQRATQPGIKKEYTTPSTTRCINSDTEVGSEVVGAGVGDGVSSEVGAACGGQWRWGELGGGCSVRWTAAMG